MGEKEERGWRCEEGGTKGGGEGREGGTMGRREEGTGERGRGGRDLFIELFFHSFLHNDYGWMSSQPLVTPLIIIKFI